MVMVGTARSVVDPRAAGAAPVVCRRCGVVAPARDRSCLVCNAILAETRALAPADRLWVAVRCTFTCNSCRFAAPLDALDADGAVECACCGLRQRFDVDAWREALAFAHAVGDLAGPGPEGRQPHPTLWIGSENPYARVGDTATFERKADISASRLAIEAAPGHPVCHACKELVTTTADPAGGVVTACARCGERAAYAVPAEARALCETLLAVVADEHRTDRPRARTMPTQTGVEALACPSCGAPLGVTSGRRLQTCAFCKASCIVPVRSSAQRGDATPAPEVWWVLFQGPSTKRAELEAPTEDAGVTKVKAALDFLKPGGSSAAPIGDAPGVYAAPTAPGIYWPQVLLTLVLGSAAAAIGLAIYEALLR